MFDKNAIWEYKYNTINTEQSGRGTEYIFPAPIWSDQKAEQTGKGAARLSR